MTLKLANAKPVVWSAFASGPGRSRDAASRPALNGADDACSCLSGRA